MNDTFMTLCDSCAEKMDAAKRPENRYYLDALPGSRRTTACTICGQLTGCTQYRAKSKNLVAMERAIAKQRQQSYGMKKDNRAYYREPWRGE